MRRNEVILTLCKLVGEVGDKIFKGNKAHDCFCEATADSHFCVEQEVMEFIVLAVKDKIKSYKEISMEIPSVTSMPNKTRESFERIYLAGNKQTARVNEHGDYVLPAIQDAWSGWKAAHVLLILKP